MSLRWRKTRVTRVNATTEENPWEREYHLKSKVVVDRRHYTQAGHALDLQVLLAESVERIQGIERVLISPDRVTVEVTPGSELDVIDAAVTQAINQYWLDYVALPGSAAGGATIVWFVWVGSLVWAAWRVLNKTDKR